METRDICTIYVVSNSVNSKVYIGQTWQTLNKRFDSHVRRKNCIKLYNAIKKYGKDKFQINPILSAWTQEDADFYEIYFIKYYNSIKTGYNLKEGGARGKLLEESKRKISLANAGENNGRAKLSNNDVAEIKRLIKDGELSVNIAKLFNVDHSAISDIKNGVNWDDGFADEWNKLTRFEKLSISAKGRIHSEETKLKISISNTGHPVSKETREKISNALHSSNNRTLKLTKQQVLEIKILLNNNKSATSIAKYYNTSRESIKEIANGKNWARVKISTEDTLDINFINQFENKGYAIKLDERKVKEIKKLLHEGLTETAIAKQFGVKRTTIAAIHQGRSWKHVLVDNEIISEKETI
jgi:group I intron endonuclease